MCILFLTNNCFHFQLLLITGFLPSSFSMYAISLSSALFLFGKHATAVAVAATGVILGWPFSILAFLPVTVYSLIRRFKQAFISGTFVSITLLVRKFLSFMFFIYFGTWNMRFYDYLV